MIASLENANPNTLVWELDPFSERLKGSWGVSVICRVSPYVNVKTNLETLPAISADEGM